MTAAERHELFDSLRYYNSRPMTPEETDEAANRKAVRLMRNREVLAACGLQPSGTSDTWHLPGRRHDGPCIPANEDPFDCPADVVAYVYGLGVMDGEREAKAAIKEAMGL